MHTKAYTYQMLGARSIHRFGGRALLADEMGLGKSLQALLYAERHPDVRPIVIVCPAGLKYNWQRECSTHFGWHAQILEGIKPNGCIPYCPIVIINYDIIEPWLPYLIPIQPKLVILDEAHYLQNPGTKRTKLARALCQGVPHVIALTGTPLVNRPIEMWPTLNILYPKEFPSYYGFGMSFCAPRRNPFSGGWDFKGASNLDILSSKLKHVMIRRKKADVLQDLPPKVRHVVPLDIADRGQYEYAQQDFVDWLARHKPEKLAGALKAERLTRMGYLKRLAATLKLPSVFEWVDAFLRESDGKLILFGLHRSILGQLHGRYRHQAVLVHGSVKGQDRQAAVDQFQQHNPTRLFIGQIRAAGVGLNLTKAHDVAFCEMDWTAAAHEQAEDRAYGRLSDLHGANSWWLVGQDTIETHLVQILQHKAEVCRAVLDGSGKSGRLDVYSQLCTALSKGVQQA